MKSFKFEAIDGHGAVRKGRRVAADRAALEDFFAQQGLSPLSVEEVKSYRSRPIRRRRLLARLFRNMKLFLESGMELIPALSQVKDRLDEPQLAACLETVITDLQNGRSLADSLRSCSPYIPPAAHRLCAVGEQSGQLAEVCGELSDYFKVRYQFLEKLYNLLLYPLIVLGIGCLILVFLLIYVLPRLSALLQQPDSSLPFMTRFLLSLSSFTRSWYILPVLLLFSLGGYAIYRLFKRPVVQNYLAWLLLYSALYRRLKTQLLALTMSMCLRVNMEIDRALELTRQVVGNPYLQERLRDVTESVRGGHMLTDSLQRNNFDMIPYDSLATGEQSGNLGGVFEFQAELLQEEIDETLSRVVTLFEPVMILLLTGVVGFILAAVMLPIVQMSTAF